MLDARHTGCRLIHGESDGLPGVVADRYASTVVLQLSSAGAERWRERDRRGARRGDGRRVRVRALGCRGAHARRAAAPRRRACTARCPIP